MCRPFANLNSKTIAFVRKDHRFACYEPRRWTVARITVRWGPSFPWKAPHSLLSSHLISLSRGTEFTRKSSPNRGPLWENIPAFTRPHWIFLNLRFKFLKAPHLISLQITVLPFSWNRIVGKQSLRNQVLRRKVTSFHEKYHIWKMALEVAGRVSVGRVQSRLDWSFDALNYTFLFPEQNLTPNSTQLNVVFPKLMYVWENLRKGSGREKRERVTFLYFYEEWTAFYIGCL